MDFDKMVQEGLRRSNERFMASMTKILDQYNRDFKDDILVSIETLTYETSEGPKEWEKVSRKTVKKWKKEILTLNSHRASST
ncbi:Holliday junction recognition protein-like, partial [Passer montanus]|uniref:Holliday junction recognition protein-like n=1 Tax=Passer montanus TaxID=9160 RepID=UPI00195FD582